MTRRQVAKYSRLTLAIFLVFCIFILATRDEKFPTALDGTSSIERTTLRPSIFKKDFCVFDHKCKIPRLNPFADEVIGIFKPPKFKECTDQRDIINVVYDVTKRQYLLHVNATLVGILYRNITAFACIYYEIVRGANDSITWWVCINRSAAIMLRKPHSLSGKWDPSRLNRTGSYHTTLMASSWNAMWRVTDPESCNAMPSRLSSIRVVATSRSIRNAVVSILL